MNEQLNFRIYDKVRKQYMSGGELVFALYGDTRISVMPNAPEYCYVETKQSDFIIEQSSGEKDNAGKEIFKGDLIQYPNGDIKEVTFLGGSFGVLTENSFGSYYTWRYGIVIGNIHQNEEL